MTDFNHQGQNVNTQYNAENMYFGDSFVVAEYLVKEIDIEKISKTFVPPRSYSKIKDDFSKRNLLCLVGPPGIGKRSLALKLALDFKGSIDEIFIVPRFISWSKLKGLEKKGAIFIFPDALGSVDFERSNIEVELNHLERLCNNQNKIILTSTHEIFVDAQHASSQLDELIAKIGSLTSLETNEYDDKKRIRIFREKIEYAHSKVGVISDNQKRWGLALIEDSPDAAKRPDPSIIVGNRHLFNQLLTVTWLPIDIDRFVLVSLRLANNANDMGVIQMS